MGKGTPAHRAALAGVVVLALSGADPAVAADVCPNAEIRQQQGAARLPECRAYEQVSPPHKNGNAVLGGYAPARAGGAFAFLSPGAFADAQSAITVNYVAERTGSGWRTTAVNPPMVGDRNPSLLDETRIMGASDDLTRVLLQTQYPISPDDDSANDEDLFLRTPDGAHNWISHGPTLPAAYNQSVVYMGASADLSHVLFAARRALTPEVPEPVSQPQLYEWTDGQVRLVSKDTDGNPLLGGAVAGGAGGALISEPFGKPDAISDDGRTIFFTSPPNTTSGRVYARTDGTSTVDVGLSQKETPDADAPRLTRYWDASPDGRYVLFSTPDGLTDGTPRIENGSDHHLYRYDTVSGELRNVSPYRNPSAPAEEQALGPRVTEGLAVADDGSRVYFRSSGRLVEGLPTITTDQRFLYRYDAADDDVTFLGVVGSAEANSERSFAVSPSGRYLAVESTRRLDGDGSVGAMNLYLHDAVAGTTTCVTCPGGFDKYNPNGVEYREANRPFNRVTDDGRVFFTTNTGLAPGDANGVADAYMWHAGAPHLISSGSDAAPSMFVGATADAREVYFLTNESLVGHDIDNGVADVYVARVGGGFPEPVAPAQCADKCQQPSPAPAAPALATAIPGAEPAALPPRPVARVARLSRSARARLARGRAVNVRVRVNRSGTLRMTARARVGKRSRVVGRAVERATRAGTERLRLRLSRAARARLRRGKALRVAVDVRFTGVREPERLAFTLRPAGDR